MSLALTSKKFVIIGFIAGSFLLALYFLILSVASSFSHAIEQFSQMWYWILLLTAGFGLQVGLYFFIRASFRLKQMTSPTAVVATSGGISAGSMVACCLHYLVNVLPLIGLAAATVFLTKYQLLFIVVGILSNLIGITIMLEIIQKHSLSQGFLKRIMIYNMNKIKKIAIVSSLVLSAGVFIFIGGFWRKEVKEKPELNLQAGLSQEQKLQSELPETINLPSKTDNQNEVSFKITPTDFNFDNPVKFEIEINTHSGSLDFDLTRVSILEDNKGNKYQPLDWQGSPSGGHHRSGILLFPKLDIQAKEIKLIIKDVSNIPSRVFEWKLNNE